MNEKFIPVCPECGKPCKEGTSPGTFFFDCDCEQTVYTEKKKGK